MKEKVENVLKETGYSEERGAKMDVDDLLKYVFSTFCSELYSQCAIDYCPLSMI